MVSVSNPNASKAKLAEPAGSASAPRSYAVVDSVRPQPDVASPNEREATPSGHQDMDNAAQQAISDPNITEMQRTFVNLDEQPRQYDHQLEPSGGGDISDPGSIETTSNYFLFNDDETWDSMFTNAGFNVHDGVFLPS